MRVPEQPLLPFPQGIPEERRDSESWDEPERRTFRPELDSFTRENAFELLERLPACSVDLIVTDPPYESLELHRSRGSTTRLMGNWFETVRNEQLPRLFELLFRVLKDDRHFYLFCDEFTADVIKEQQGICSRRDRDGARPCRSGFRYWRELIWAKTTRSSGKIQGGMGYHYRSASERILFFEKGKRRLNDLGIADVLPAPRPDGIGPAPKPLELHETFIAQSTQPDELVLDPFAGTGVAGLAAMRLSRHFWLGDLDDSFLLPEVREKALPRARKFLLVLPKTRDPEVFLEAVLQAELHQTRLAQAVAHDRDIFGLSTPEGRALLRKWSTYRPLERAPLFRRYLRGHPWKKAAQTATEEQLRDSPSLAIWLKWLER